MGKGDKKTKRGKIVIGSYGVRRPRKKKIISATKPKAKVETKVKSDTKPKTETKVKTATKPKAEVKETPKAKKTTKKKVDE